MRRREFLVATAALAAACRRPPEPLPPTPMTAVGAALGTSQTLLVDGGGRFAAFLGEVLGAEGLVGVSTCHAASAAPDLPASLTAIVVHGSSLPLGWVDAIDAFVRRGGVVVAMVPGAALLERFGIDDRGAVAADGVRLLHRGDDSALRLHVEGRRWRPARRHVVEASFTGAAGDLPWPAALRVPHGNGAAVLWAFDVAYNVALIRQGNPAWADTDREALSRHQVDAMVGWIHTETLSRPDADLYQQAVSAVVAAGTRVVGPQPVIDYFPGSARSVLIATSDAHGVGAAVLDALVRRVESFDARLSIYYTPPPTARWRRTARRARWTLGRLPLVGEALQSDLGPPSPHLIDAWRARGHEFAPHPRTDEGLDVESGLAQAWDEFENNGYGGVHVSTRTHKILWSGWVRTAQLQRRRGVRMNLDAYHLGPALRGADGSWPHGHVIGSGLPLRFVDESGVLVDCYQQPTQIVDEHLVGIFGGLANLSAEDAVRVAIEIIHQATGTTPAALCGQFHADGFVGSTERIRAARLLLDGTLAACRTAGVPVWTAARWLAFLDERRAVTVTARTWNAAAGRLATSVSIGGGMAPGAGVLLPAAVDGRTIARVKVGGTPTPVVAVTRGGRDWVRVVVPPGTTDLAAEYRSP
jgi:hypothetical protein